VSVPDRIGVVFQDYSVFPWMTVARNIAFGLDDLDGTVKAATVEHYLELIQLKDKARRYPGELSGGQVQRVAIARAFAPEPDLILMDEPFGSLDRHTRDRMQHWLLGVWNERHKTIVFVTHDIEEAVFLSDRVIVLGQRKIEGEFTVSFGRPRPEGLKFADEFVHMKQQVLFRLGGSIQAVEEVGQ
jgi:ABC-type nitrate/sulfonate/bicarbonate transport system ATPase subunit